MAKRKNGWYWVKFDKRGLWVVRCYFQGMWILRTMSEPRSPSIIGPILEPPEEKRNASK